MINPRKTADKNFKSIESKGVPIAITKINPLPSSVEDTPATSGFRPATIRSISPPKQSSDSSIFDLNFPPLSYSNKDLNKKLHPIRQIDHKQPTCLNQDLSPPRSSYKFFKHRQTRPSSGCKVDSSPSPSFSPLSSSDSIMVLPTKRPIESEDIDGGKSAKMKIFSSSLSLAEEKYNQTNGKPEPQADFSSTNGTINTFDNDKTQQGDKAGENHYDDNIIVIDTVKDDKSHSNGIDQSETPKVYATKSKANDDKRYVSNPVFPTESTQDSCMSNESSNSATTSKSSNSDYRFYTTSNRNWRRKQDMSRSSVTVCDNQNTSTSGDGMMAKTAIDDQKKKSCDKSAKNGKSKSNTTTTSKSKNASAKACGHSAQNSGNSEQPLNNSKRKNKIVVQKKPCSAGPAERKSNRLNRAPSRTDARPQRNVHSVYSKVTLHEKKEKLEAQQKNKKVKPPSVKSQSVAVARSSRNERSLLASNKIKKVPLPAQNQSSKHSNEPPTQSSLSKGPSTTTTTTITENNTMTFPDSPQTVKVVEQSQGQNSSTISSSYGSDLGQSGSNPSVSISQTISSTLNSNNGGQSPKQISGPFIRIIQKGKPAEASGISTVPYDSPIRSPRSEIKRIEEQEKIKFFVINKPEEVKPLPAVSNGNVGLAQCSNRTVKECIRQCKEQQQQPQQAQQSNTMSQRYRVARQQMQNDFSKWICIFCKKQQYEDRLGPLFGPYFDPSSVFLPEIWFHEDCYMWTMLPMVTPARPLPPEAIHVIRMCSMTTCLRCGLEGANIQCMAKSCPSICLHYFCALQRDYFFDETSSKIFCPEHYESIVLGKTRKIDPMENLD